MSIQWIDSVGNKEGRESTFDVREQTFILGKISDETFDSSSDLESSMLFPLRFSTKPMDMYHCILAHQHYS